MTIPEYRIERQLSSNLCWAAVASSISYYYAHFTEAKTFWTQQKIVQAAFPERNCKEALSNCNERYRLDIALKGIGHLDQEVDSAVLYNSIQNEIDARHPLCCQILFGDRKSHFVVIYGYDNEKVIIADPQLDPHYYRIPFQNFVVAYKGGKWIRTYSTKL